LKTEFDQIKAPLEGQDSDSGFLRSANPRMKPGTKVLLPLFL
jgi:hypothetical protein